VLSLFVIKLGSVAWLRVALIIAVISPSKVSHVGDSGPLSLVVVVVVVVVVLIVVIIVVAFLLPCDWYLWAVAPMLTARAARSMHSGVGAM